MGAHQVLPLQVIVDPGAIALKGYSSFLKAPALLEPHHQIVEIVVYSAFCLDVAHGHKKGAPNEIRTLSCRFAS